MIHASHSAITEHAKRNLSAKRICLAIITSLTAVLAAFALSGCDFLDRWESTYGDNPSATEKTSNIADRYGEDDADQQTGDPITDEDWTENVESYRHDPIYVDGQELVDMFSTFDPLKNYEYSNAGSWGEYIKNIKYVENIKYLGDTLYRVNMQPYTGVEEYVYMFPYKFRVIADGDSMPSNTAMMLDPNEEFFISNYNSDGVTITMNENYWCYPNELEPSLYEIMRKNNITFSTDTGRKITDYVDGTDLKRGEEIVNFAFIGVVTAEEQAQITGKQLTVAFSNPHIFGLVRVPFKEHVFPNVKDTTLEELNVMFANANAK